MKKILRNGKIRLLLIIGSLLLLVLFFYWQNNHIVVSEIVYYNEEIPEAFQGFRILQISDLHNKEFGEKQAELIRQTKDIQPDIIVITGDIIDSNRTDLTIAQDYVSQAVQIAPVYYVSGNHEKWSGVYPLLKQQLETAGVIVLDNESILLEKSGQNIMLAGMSDPDFWEEDLFEGDRYQQLDEILKELLENKEGYFNVLLSHRPELISQYADYEFDLVFSGHAHGGQFRLPFLGGIYAPNQGFFPKYTKGLNQMNQTSMIVSRGLGNSVIPVRIFNPPELIVLTLNSK